tara:strand:+ start:163 stop:1623 length:1461 start_codon:yes stop_codon:yes gene_type:complete
MSSFYTSTFTIVFICIIVGVIIIGASVALIYKFVINKNDNKTNLPLPPLDYMDTTTLNCPDYWNVIEDEDGIVTCENNTGGYNNSIQPDDTLGTSYNKYITNTYIYPNNKKTQDLLDDLDNKTIYRNDCSASDVLGINNRMQYENRNGINYTCPISHPFPVRFNETGNKQFDDILCSKRQNVSSTLQIHKTDWAGQKNQDLLVWCGTNNNTSKDGTNIDNFWDISLNKCDMPNIKCDKFYDYLTNNYTTNYTKICPPKHPKYIDGSCCDLSDNNCKDLNNDIDWNFRINGLEDKTGGYTSSQYNECPTNYPYAVNLVDGDNTYHGVFCSNKNSNDVEKIPKDDDDYIGCNETNINSKSINVPDDLFFSCSSNPTCPIEYPFKTEKPGEKECCKTNPKIDIDGNCSINAYTTSCPNNTDVCKSNYETTCKKTQEFPKINTKKWLEIYSDAMAENDLSKMSNIKGMTERCNWINTCGRVWQGVSEFCL